MFKRLWAFLFYFISKLCFVKIDEESSGQPSFISADFCKFCAKCARFGKSLNSFHCAAVGVNGSLFLQELNRVLKFLGEQGTWKKYINEGKS